MFPKSILTRGTHFPYVAAETWISKMGDQELRARFGPWSCVFQPVSLPMGLEMWQKGSMAAKAIKVVTTHPTTKFPRGVLKTR